MLAQARCRCCGRPLSDPASIAAGIGPVCAVRGRGEEQMALNDYDHPYDGGDVRIWRDERGIVHANVPHVLIQHSPTGYEVGYGGSGPADLALNILFTVAGNRTIAERHHQAFKQKFIATMDEGGGTISRDLVLGFVRQCVRERAA